MKVLADTCVWSLALRRRRNIALPTEQARALEALTNAVKDGMIVLIGPIRQEILSGIRDKSQFTKTAQLLDPFTDEELTRGDYIEAARLFNVCRDHGVECGAIDMQLCTIAGRTGSNILTFDKALLRCIHVLQRARQLPRTQ